MNDKRVVISGANSGLINQLGLLLTKKMPPAKVVTAKDFAALEAAEAKRERKRQQRLKASNDKY